MTENEPQSLESEPFPKELRETPRPAETVTSDRATPRRRQDRPFTAPQWRQLQRRFVPALEQRSQRVETPRHGEGRPDAAAVDPWALQGAAPATSVITSAPPPSAVEEKQIQQLLRQLLQTAEKILARLGQGGAINNPFDFLA